MRRKLFRRFICAALCLALLAGLPVLAAERIDGYTLELVPGAELTHRVSWTGSDYLRENYIELSYGSDVWPVVVSHETLCSVGGVAEAAQALEAQGLHPIAAINGGFYNVSSRVPVGVIMSGGALRSDADGIWALGIKSDGSAVMGLTGLNMSLNINGRTYTLEHFNKSREKGFALYSSDFAATTKTSGDGVFVLCSTPDAMTPGSTVTFTVEQVTAQSGAYSLPEGKYVLSLSADAGEYSLSAISALIPGSIFTLDISFDEGWEDVDSALGILYPMIADGAKLPGLKNTAEPRSAVGIKSDGSLVLYTCDGRKSGHSVGIGLDAAADELLRLGCVWAGALDGGGSTNIWAALPGTDSVSQINLPSDGRERQVVDFIFLTVPTVGGRTSPALSIQPYTINALVGAGVPLTVTATDGLGHSTSLPYTVSYSMSGDMGYVSGGVFQATRSGEGLITASAPGYRSVSIPVRVVDSPDEIRLYGEVYGKLTSSLTLDPAQEVDLTAAAYYNHVKLSSSDENFNWALDEAAGTVDATGHITAAADGGEGLLAVSAGQTTVSIPIKAMSPLPFTDLANTDWYYQAVKYCYENGLLFGTDTDKFSPQRVMTRAMIVTVLWRMEGSPLASSPCTFYDVSPEDWYYDAVAWAQENNIIAGYPNLEFRPMGDLSHEQIAAILHRLSGYPQADEAELEAWADGGEVSDYARQAVAWACRSGQSLVGGYASDKLLPTQGAQRAEVADILMRYIETPK